MSAGEDGAEKFGIPEEPEVPTEPAEERHELPPKAGAKRSSKGSLLEGAGKQEKRKRSCPDYFGVKSYLHNFYESHVYKDPSIYEDDDDLRFLLHANPRRRRCPPIWWKIFMWVGVNLLLFGVIGILVGYLVPPKSNLEQVDHDSGIAFVNRSAEAYNTTLDMCKLVGLILFCIGGVTLAMSLLFPSFLSQHCQEEAGGEDAIRVPLRRQEEKAPPRSPIEMTVPATAQLHNVQPHRKAPQAVITQSGAVAVGD